MSNKTVFTNEITEYLIENVHAAEYVWDHSSPLYKLKGMKCDFWLRLTADINSKFQPAIPLTQGDVSRKWNNLKSYYTFECQRFMKAEKIEYVPDMVQVDWKNKSKMDFLAKLITPNFKRLKNENTKSNPVDDGFFNNSNFESQDESWTGDSGTQNSFQVPEQPLDIEEEKFGDILKEREIRNETDDQQTTSLNNVHSSTHLDPISTYNEDDDQTSIIKSYKRPRESADRLSSVVADLIEQQNSLRTAPTLQHPEMYAFWDSIIKELPAEALPEIKFEVTAVLHTIYKKYKK